MKKLRILCTAFHKIIVIKYKTKIMFDDYNSQISKI